MWVFDGEEWTEEGATETRKPDEPMRPAPGEFYPELQVIEIVPVPTPQPQYVPFPLP